jgi:predicted transcriptional regulator
MKKKAPEKLLTDVELEFMSVIWILGEASVNDVIDQLPPERKVAYTSVSTILRILEQKGVLMARKEGRGHVYVPTFSKSDYEAVSLQHMVNKVFGGTPVALVRQLLGSVKMKPDEVAELKNLLSKMEKGR